MQQKIFNAFLLALRAKTCDSIGELPW